MPESGHPAIAVVVVTYQSAEHLPALVQALAGQLREGDELIVVDNASSDGTAAVAGSLDARIQVLETGGNLGFAAGCQLGAEASEAPLLLFLNPDSKPHQGCLDSLRSAAGAHPEWGAWQAAVLLEDGRINTSGGVIHYLGFGWAGGCERPARELPEHDSEVAFPSGAALIVRRTIWRELGGLDREYFMYGEDLDLGLRLWLAGHHVGVVPSALVTHAYDFDKGSGKWFWLERNRWRTVLSVYPTGALLLLAPALLAAELGLLAIAAQQGWLGAKLRAQAAAVRALPRTWARRRALQRKRAIGSREFATHLSPSLDSPYLAGADNPLIAAPQAFYWRLVLLVLSLRRR